MNAGGKNVKDNVVRDRSFDFAVEVVKFCQRITADKREFILSKQLMRAGTSIGANVREAINGQSRADFIHKMAIAQKECDESIYWLELMDATNLIQKSEYSDLHSKANELLRLLRSIILTAKNNS